jgi:hypothetical protein
MVVAAMAAAVMVAVTVAVMVAVTVAVMVAVTVAVTVGNGNEYALPRKIDNWIFTGSGKILTVN